MSDSLPSSVSFDTREGSSLDASDLTEPRQERTAVELRDLTLARKVAGDAAAIIKRQQEELIALKLQLAKQMEALGVLSSKLGQSKVDTEALVAERTALVDELAASRSEPKTVAQRRFSMPSRLPADSHATLVEDNARLRASVDGLRTAFQKHIKVTHRKSREDQRAFEKLQRDNATLREQLVRQEAMQKQWREKKPSTTSEGTSKTAPESCNSVSDEDLKVMNALVDAYQESIKSVPRMRPFAQSLPPQHRRDPLLDPRQLDASNTDTWILEGGEDIEAPSPGVDADKRTNDADRAKGKGEKAPRRRSDELLVDFGEARRARSDARRRHSLMY